MGLKVDVTLPAEMKALPGLLLSDLKKAARVGLKQGVQIVLGAVREAAGGEILTRRTGNLARSFYGTGVEPEEGGYAARIGSRAVYARIQEEGGTVRPVKAGALAIPIAANLTPRGVPRFPSPADLKEAYGANNVFLLKRQGQTPLLMAKTGKTDKSAKPFFALKKSVDVPASHYITQTLEKQADTVRSRIATEVFVAAVNAKEGGS